MPDIPTYPFSLPSLRFKYSDFEPLIDTATLKAHHQEHHGIYVEKLNALLSNEPSLHSLSIEALLRAMDSVPGRIREQIRDTGGGHANHQFFWKILKPLSVKMSPRGSLREALERDFSSMEDFQNAFTESCLAMKSPGWVFLVVNPKQEGRLEIFSGTGNESVLYHGTPGLLICDLWEHARPTGQSISAYLETFWQIVDWEAVHARLEGIRLGRSQL